MDGAVERSEQDEEEGACDVRRTHSPRRPKTGIVYARRGHDRVPCHCRSRCGVRCAEMGTTEGTSGGVFCPRSDWISRIP